MVNTRQEGLQAAETLRQHSLDLRKLSAHYVRYLVRDFFDAGWSAADVLHAIDHLPDGRPWPFAGMPRHVPGWTRHRLKAWRAADGSVLPSKSHRIEADRQRVRAEQEAMREQWRDMRRHSLGWSPDLEPTLPSQPVNEVEKTTDPPAS
ncbi:hypothetical protein [Nonomuraea sp. NPDC049400]|uniref:hypothetical protein n=1 Tax=Nonomuraea sp. NPDC049400 TaxID=3364352 RepID=UPI00379A5154